MKWKLDRIYTLAKIYRTSDHLDHSINQTIKFIDAIHQASISNVKPMHHPLDLVQNSREDQITESDQHAIYQDNASCTEDSFYLVPKVIE